MFPDHGCVTCPMLCKNERAGEWQCWYDRDCPDHTVPMDAWKFTPVDEKVARYITLTSEGAEHEHPNSVKAREESRKRIFATTRTGQTYQINYGDLPDADSGTTGSI